VFARSVTTESHWTRIRSARAKIGGTIGIERMEGAFVTYAVCSLVRITKPKPPTFREAFRPRLGVSVGHGGVRS